MTPEEAEKQLLALSTNLTPELAKASLVIAADMLDRVQQRVQEEGKKSDGTLFKPYSTNPLPLYFFEKQATQAQLNRLKKNKNYKKYGLSYEGFRRETGKQTRHKDLTFTGQMWRNTGVVQQTSGEGVTVITIGGLSEESRQKHEWMTQQQGVYLQLTETELNLQTTNLNKAVNEIVLKYLR